MADTKGPCRKFRIAGLLDDSYPYPCQSHRNRDSEKRNGYALLPVGSTRPEEAKL
jgi:hypothetical protein